MSQNVVFLPGDGVGPEVADAARRVLDVLAAGFGLDLAIETHDFGGAAIDAAGDPLPQTTLDACLKADAVFLGAIGGPKWDKAPRRPEQGLLQLRQEMGVFANLRPTLVQPGTEHLSPLKDEVVRDVDMLIVRELTGGMYFGTKEEGTEVASDNCTYSRGEVERVARVAFEAAQKRSGRLTSVDKANVLATSRLWRAVVIDVSADYPDVTLDHMLVDAMAMKLIQSPGAYDVVLTENLFGDILSDEASVLAGSIGLGASASLGGTKAGLYEPIHGSAPDIAGEGKANPVGALLSLEMMLRYSLDAAVVADALDAGLKAVMAAGAATADIGGSDTTGSFADKLVAKLAA